MSTEIAKLIMMKMKERYDVVMEIISPRKENKKDIPEYGCVCESCGTAFIFNRSEIKIPRTPFPKPSDLKITCPECNRGITLSSCQEFKTEKDKQKFRNKYKE